MEKYLKRIKEKLEKNPELEEQIGELHSKLEEIFECGVELSLIDMDLANDYDENFQSYGDISDELDTMTLSEFIEFLNEESDVNSKLLIDPIYLKKGLNEINNVLITTIDDNKVIIVPKSKNYELK